VQEQFERLRVKERSYSQNKLDINKSFEGSLFPSRPWYLDDDFQVEKPNENTPLKSNLNNEGKFNNSAHESGKQKLEEAIKSNTIELFKSNLHSCKKCLNEVFEEKKFQVESSSGEKNIDILFVSDTLKEEEGNVVFLPKRQQDLLDKMISAMKLDPESYKLTVGIKCLPKSDSLTATSKLSRECIGHLWEEILLYRPKFVISLGALATNQIREEKARLTDIHGKFFPLKVENQSFECTLVPIFHPSLLLINQQMKRTTWYDLQKVMRKLGII
jgi:DNA polymerase